jgi:hypothetical protein
MLFFMTMLVTGCQAYAGTPMTDENGLGFEEFKKGDVVDYDINGNPIFLGGIPDLDLEVYRGTKSVAGEFPTSGWIGNCTANAVALDVVITAGHCKGTGARISFAHRESGKSYSATCTRHPRYNTRTIYNDWSLCKLDSPLPAGSKLLTFSKERPAVGVAVWINGFGAPNVGTHYWGTSKVKSYNGQDLITNGPSNLGGGDSGGTLIPIEGPRDLSVSPMAVGVNSRGGGGYDYYNYYAHSEFQSWAREYETAKGVKLCGISADCLGPVDPVDCEGLLDYLTACVVEAAPGCRKAYTDLNACIKDSLQSTK